MALSPGTRLGPYEILGPIGAGGMGEVYKATDTRLNRTVAIKVLPTHFAHDPDMKQRFEREAQTIAGLNHPNICILHDIGEQDGTHFLVMEYVEGETLADRISRGPLPLGEVLRIAGEIIDALDRAHRQGIVHRDLKPANVMLAKASRTGATASTKIITAPIESIESVATPPSDPAAPGAAPSSKSGRPASSAPSLRSSSSHTKLLDFGLAKWVVPGGNAISAQSTRMDVTTQGTMIGTLQYMAPEQVEGKEADSRTDLFALGAVLYEMLTGKRAFEGKSQASLIGAIMKAEPRPISHHAPETPAVLEHMIARCLVKDPEERWQTAHDLKLQLAWISRSRTDTSVSPAVAEAERKRARLTMILIACALTVGAALAVPAYFYWRGPAAPEALQFRHTIMGLSAPDISISPNGRLIAFVAKPDSSGASSLYVRQTGGLTARKIPGTDGATLPFWSPDSAYIAFATGGKLKKVEASGGAAKELTDAKDFSGGAWSEANSGTILFGTAKGLNRVSAEGGTATVLTALDKEESGHLWPSFLPDGKHYLYLAWSEDAAKRAVYLGSLDAKDRKEQKRLIAAETNAVYAASTGSRQAASTGSRQAAPGYILFHREATLFAQPFSTKALEFTGDPVQVAGGVSTAQTGRGLFSVSQTGALLYFQGATGGGSTGRGGFSTTQFGFVDRTGGRVEIGVESGLYGDMDLSPDGTLIAVTKPQAGAATADIWVIDWQKDFKPTRLTTDPSDDVDPVWSPDGKQIAFTTWRKGNADIYVKNANNVGADRPLVESPMNESIEAWSRDGRFIAFECGQDEFQDICVAPIDASNKVGKPSPVVQGHHRKNEPQFSYDGKWLAYTSDINDGRFEVFVQSFPGGEIKQQISTEGGGQPRWRRDGKEMYYRTLDNRLMAVDLALGAKIEPGLPRQLFLSTSGNATTMDPIRHMWTALPDGQHFLTRVATGARSSGAGAAGTGTNLPPAFTPPGQTGTRPGGPGPQSNGLTVLLHWTSSLAKGGK